MKKRDRQSWVFMYSFKMQLSVHLLKILSIETGLFGRVQFQELSVLPSCISYETVSARLSEFRLVETMRG